jgi:hypothetical protein
MQMLGKVAHQHSTRRESPMYRCSTWYKLLVACVCGILAHRIGWSGHRQAIVAPKALGVGLINVDDTATSKLEWVAIEDEDAESSLSPGSPEPCNPTDFKYAHDVFLDDRCYPPLFRSTTVQLVSGARSTATNTLEPIVTQTWRLTPEYSRFDNLQQEPSVLKMFEDCLVYTVHPTTYFKNDKVWSASERCLQTGKTVPVAFKGDATGVPIIDAAVLLTSQQWGGAHFHYIAEKALIIGPARSVLEQPHVKLIVEQSPEHLLAFYELLGIERSRVVISGQPMRVRKLYLPYYAQCGFVNSETLQLTRKWLQDRFPELYSKRPILANGILVVDRRENGICNRCLENTDAIIVALQKAFPTRKVFRYMGDIPLKQQMEAFASGELIVAPHGAGLVNLVFAPNHAKVIEIYNNPHEVNYCFFDLALGLRLRYRMLSPLKTSDSMVDFTKGDVTRILQTAKSMLASA